MFSSESRTRCPYGGSIIFVLLPITRASSNGVTFAAGAWLAKVSRGAYARDNRAAPPPAPARRRYGSGDLTAQSERAPWPSSPQVAYRSSDSFATPRISTASIAVGSPGLSSLGGVAAPIASSKVAPASSVSESTALTRTKPRPSGHHPDHS